MCFLFVLSYMICVYIHYVSYLGVGWLCNNLVIFLGQYSIFNSINVIDKFKPISLATWNHVTIIDLFIITRGESHAELERQFFSKKPPSTPFFRHVYFFLFNLYLRISVYYVSRYCVYLVIFHPFLCLTYHCLDSFMCLTIGDQHIA